MSQRHETDVLIIGGGISAALMAEKLAERQPAPSIIVVEAGQKIFDVENRMRYRQRMLEYGENPWPGDTIGDQSGVGIISRTMAVGGSALHWGGVTNRFFRGGFASQVAVRPRGRLADRLGRARALLLRSGAAHRRCRRAGAARRGSAVGTVPMPPMPLSTTCVS